ncbi:phenolic glucoside malonyltransferase 2-like protein [Cinnamomum micranthum f. kanehirae]|uniref:Phenolic glucoside malonyltransferase 2-like protein n=1 Tax=Cinnamomum micranthum f. kanehirae TaxID=337451 RepID=A0A3S3MRQ8_9MAGN|nr:phenolic glucoside malonyltransferase 2-like protein [Cinnamomum micranthum f. kanehirae]
MAPPHTVKVLDLSRVAPPPGSVSEASLPLTLFDVLWVQAPPVQRLFFYEFSPPNTTTTSDFFNTLLPHLKHSLSLALQFFYPLSGNLTFSSQTCEHEIRYVDGDSVSLTVAESPADFHHLVGNHPKEAEELHPLVSQLPTASLLALQVTLFPNSGFCIGIILHHAVADGRSLAHFMKSWASICRTGDASSITALPLFDRSLVEDVKGLKKIFLTQMADIKMEETLKDVDVANQVKPVRATFVMGRAQIERLRQRVLARRPELPHCTPFVLTCAYVWVCLVKARGDVGDKTVHFSFAVDCRARLDPPMPAMYFGNCLGFCMAEANGSDLAQEDGLAAGSDSIGRAIRGLADGGLMGAEKWIPRFVEIFGERVVSVAGSPKFRVYDTDFGWGRRRKTEVLSIEQTGAIYIGESRYEEGGIEIGVAISRSEMDGFASLFEEVVVNFESGWDLTFEQMKDLALGLEMSEQRLLWVVWSPNDREAWKD